MPVGKKTGETSDDEDASLRKYRLSPWNPNIMNYHAAVRIHRAKARFKEALDHECTFYTTIDGTTRCERKNPGCGQ